jgi:hypothetical protein
MSRSPDALGAPPAILDGAQSLVESTDWSSAFWWCRGAALLARQALELSLKQFWEMHQPGMELASVRAQFLALHDVKVDRRTIADGHIAWDLLTRACHHHPYELSPAQEEIVDWIATVRRVHEQLVAHPPTFR